MRVQSPGTTLLILLLSATGAPASASDGLPLLAVPYLQQTHRAYTTAEGLPSGGVIHLVCTEPVVLAQGDAGQVFGFDGDQWSPASDVDPAVFAFPPVSNLPSSAGSIRAVAASGDEFAVAAAGGLYLGDGTQWNLALPVSGNTRWAPMDVRAVAYDADGNLWFAAPQGVGCRVAEEDWQLYTGADGLPFNDFTCMAAGPSGVWFGTTNGVIQLREGQWHFRQGGRWLLDNDVHDIVVDDKGDAWVATAKGVSRIAHTETTLAEKARFYEAEIEQYHRRTELGYVNPANLLAAGDRESAVPTFSDNDGFNTGLYLAAMSLAWAATGEDRYRDYAHNSFRALAFLSEVTQGGEYGGPEGLIARNVVPTTQPDPGAIYDEDYDLRRNARDKLWKIMERRVPVDKTGQWYWKADASSDELDGHFFGAAIYFDHVCESGEEKEAVRTVVRRLIDHLLTHGYNLVDYDGTPTRWGHFSPDDLNRNPAWHSERGLNSYSILTYLAIAHHILADQKYRDEYLRLAYNEGYGMNGMVQPKELPGPHAPGHQPDDNMAFMNYYHLIRYETDPTLLSMYQYAIRTHWEYERLERNAFANFVYGACARGKSRTDQWRTIDLSPPRACYTDAVDTLQRYPLDLIEWPMSNAHRTDLVVIKRAGDGTPVEGGCVDGYAYPIDERHETYWDWNPWALTSNAEGKRLRPGFHYLLAYYLGRYHGFIEG